MKDFDCPCLREPEKQEDVWPEQTGPQWVRNILTHPSMQYDPGFMGKYYEELMETLKQELIFRTMAQGSRRASCSLDASLK